MKTTRRLVVIVLGIALGVLIVPAVGPARHTGGSMNPPPIALNVGDIVRVSGAPLGALAATLLFMHQQPFYRAEARVVVNPVAAHASIAEANRLLSSAATARRVLRGVRAGALTASTLIAKSSVASAGAGI